MHVDGVQRTQSWLVAAIVQDVLQAKTLEETLVRAQDARRKLLQLGVFRSVSVTIDTSKGPAARADGLDVVFAIEEKRLLTGDAGVQIGNNEGSAETQVCEAGLLRYG